jgi:hypothetical protein
MKDLEVSYYGDRRLVSKKGITRNGELYWSDKLIDRQGREMFVRQWPNTPDRIFCFDPWSGKFICEAIKYSAAEPPPIILDIARKRALKRAARRAAELRKLVSAKP